MAWILHAIEVSGGAWSCRWGRHEYDTHPSLDLAVAHLRDVATEIGPSDVIAHHLDGRVVRLDASCRSADVSSLPPRKDTST